jgi:putative ABC transport system permease protein
MLSDFRHAARVLLKAPAFSAVVILIFAVGIGTTSTIFSIVNAVLLRPLPFSGAGRLVDITGVVRNAGEDTVSLPDLRDWQAQTKTFSKLAGYSAVEATLTGHGPAVSMQVAASTAELFDILGAVPLRGRVVSREDERQQADVAVLSEAAWSKRFARRESVLGETAVIDGRPATIIGVMPARFAFPLQAEPIEAWVSMPTVGLVAQFSTQRGAHFLNVLGQLAPGVTIDQANAELTQIAGRLAAAYPNSNDGRIARAEPLQGRLVASYRVALIVVIAAVGVLLLIACGNVANLLLVRATARRREMAIRSAIGASRSRLFRQLLAESVLLSTAAGIVGVAVAAGGLAVLMRVMPFDVPRLHDATLDGEVLAFLTGLSVLTGVLFGLAPALDLSSGPAADALKDTAHAITGARSARTRQMLVVAEVALSLVLLASAGLLIRSLVALQAVDPGFTAEHAVGTGLMLPESQFPDAAARVAVTERLVSAAQRVPGVTAAAASTTLPMTGSDLNIGFAVEGRPQTGAQRPSAMFFAITPDYFKAMGIRLVAGRPFTARDDQRAPAVIIISETMARRYWPSGDAVGKRMSISYNNTGPREIVGIVADVKNGSLTDTPQPSMYTPYPQTPWPILGIVARTGGDATAIVGGLTKTLTGIAPDLPIDMEVLSTFIARTTAAPRFLTWLVALFAAFALLLAGSGLFSVMAYSVAQRRREIGIRMALGARGRDVTALVVGQVVRLGAAGLVIGIAGAIAAARSFETLLFGVTPGDPLTLAAIAVTLGVVLALAAYVPARRASRIDPAEVLRAG